MENVLESDMGTLSEGPSPPIAASLGGRLVAFAARSRP
jgi:hypothetical protein